MLGVHQIKFISVPVDAKTYNRLMRASGVGTTKFQVTTPILKVKSTGPFKAQLKEENEFLRIKCKEYYADFTIVKTIPNNLTISIILGTLIDSNRKHYIDPRKP